jgi:phenylalanyl-tRNA synthetase alpha chain
LQDTFYISDPLKAGRPAPTSADDKQDYEEYFRNVRQVHESGKYGSIGYRYPWSEDESLRFVKLPWDAQ